MTNLIGNSKQFGPCTGVLSASDSIGEATQDGPPHANSVVATTTVELVTVQDHDRALFHAAERELVLAPGLSRLLLSTPNHTRDAYTISHIARLLRGVEFCRQLPDRVLQGLCQVATLQRCSPGQVVFRQGDVGDKFYIILTGSVHVVIGGSNPQPPNSDAPSDSPAVELPPALQPSARPVVRVSSFQINKRPARQRRGSVNGTIVGTLCTWCLCKPHVAWCIMPELTRGIPMLWHRRQLRVIPLASGHC